MQQPIGYLVETETKNYSTPIPDHADQTIPLKKGELYNYFWAENGVFIEAENDLIAARIPIAGGITRGLKPLDIKVYLKCGKIPVKYWEIIKLGMLTNRDQEIMYVIIREDNRYKLARPGQSRNSDYINYKPMPNTLLEIHSHVPIRFTAETCPGRPCSIGCDHTIPALEKFSSTDNTDELGFKIYGVAALNDEIKIGLRLGMYGYFHTLEFNDVFEL